MVKLKIYDTTLRDGAQGEGVSFSLEDKLRIVKKLDEFGIHYIECGWPGSNPKDEIFFQEVKKIKLSHAKICAFGSTRKPDSKTSEDANVQALLSAGIEVITIFGKSWDFHVKKALETTLEENLKMIYETVSFLKSKRKEVIYDAEHFFDGYKANKDYALKTLEKAHEAGADCLCLCDTNGGTLPWEIEEIIGGVKACFPKISLGIHTHNDNDLAVANSLVAVKCGVNMVQGTINGYGERCGNANLCSIIPNLQLKLQINYLTERRLQMLTEVSRFISELANLPHRENQPYVGKSAFTHKGGIHISAVRKHESTYEHIDPLLVGNARRILVSELSGQSTILSKAGDYGLDFTKNDPQVKEILKNVKKLEQMGYQFEGAEGSFELLVKKATGKYKKFFDLESFRVLVEKRGIKDIISEAVVKVMVNGERNYTVAEGDGPVNALDNALRGILEDFYPQLKEMKLLDYKVRVLTEGVGTIAKVRVLIESGDHEDTWGTVGVSENIIEASWQALVDSFEYKLLKDFEKKLH
ncbi:MAG: citramalate synthase [bacterium]|nr:citramalate synthase [bacterium]